MACLPNAPDIEARPQLQISKTVLDQIRQSIGRLPPESGGLLGGARETGVVTHFHFDDCAKCTGVTYTPDFESLNRLLSEHWNPKGIRLLGFVHSHPPWIRRPSTGDLAYAERLLKANQELDRLLLPIAISDGRDAEKTF